MKWAAATVAAGLAAAHTVGRTGAAPVLHDRAANTAVDRQQLAALERPRVIGAADQYLTQQPKTISARPAARRSGGAHDFFPKATTGGPIPYIRRRSVRAVDGGVMARHSAAAGDRVEAT